METLNTAPGRGMSRELGPGALVGDHVIDAAASRGGFASVYRARPVDGGAPVAIKLLHEYLTASSKALRRFRREVAAVAELDHPHIVEIHGSGTLHDGRPYMVMEWLDGHDLHAELSARGSLSLAEILEVAAQIGGALAAAHARGIIHRDLKARNVMIRRDEAGGVFAKLVDFGIAKLLEPSPGHEQLTTASRIGTPIAMAPEQIRGDAVDARTDVYAFGVLLFQLAAGRPPFDGDPAELEDLHLHASPPPLAGIAAVPPALEAIVERCLRKQMSERYATIEELLAELREVGGGAAPASEEGMGVAVRVAAADEDALDEALDRVVAALEAAGMTVVLETADMVLSVRAGADSTACAEVLDCARRLVAPGVQVTVELGQLERRGGRLVGGALLGPGHWTPTPAGGAVRLGPRAQAALSGALLPAEAVLAQ